MIPERYDFSSVFDNSICVTQSEVRWDAAYPESPIKGSRYRDDGFMTSAEINELIERLTTPKPPKEVSEQSKSGMKASKRLFKESVSKKSDDKSTEQSELILEDSKKIAEVRVRKNIEDAFGGAHEISKAKMTEIFMKLGILEPGEDLNWRAIYRDLMDDWRLDEDLYDADDARNTLLNAIDGDRSTQFKRMARKKMMVKYHNKKEPKIPEIKETYAGSHTMSQDVYNRITAPDVKLEVQEEETNEASSVLSSRKSQRICNRSEHGRKSFLERGKDLEERRLSRLSKIEQDATAKPPPTKPIKNLTDEDIARIKARKEEKKRQLELENTPSYRPSITKYKEYLKRKSAIGADWSKAPGYEKDVERRRNAYHMNQVRKEEEKKMLELPPCKRTKPSPRVMEEHHYKILNPPQIPVMFDDGSWS